MPNWVADTEFWLNVGPDAWVEVDIPCGGTPSLVVSDGATQILIKPHEDVPIAETQPFFDALADAARAYADDLRTVDDQADR